MTLSTRTSALPALLGSVEWKRFKLDIGWAGLILCMLWEEAQGSLSRWSGYLCKSITFGECYLLNTIRSAILPTEFDTPMFWSNEELEELKGTSVVGLYILLPRGPEFDPQLDVTDHIGKDEAERDFYEKVMPTVQVRYTPETRYDISY